MDDIVEYNYAVRYFRQMIKKPNQVFSLDAETIFDEDYKHLESPPDFENLCFPICHKCSKYYHLSHKVIYITFEDGKIPTVTWSYKHYSMMAPDGHHQEISGSGEKIPFCNYSTEGNDLSAFNLKILDKSRNSFLKKKAEKLDEATFKWWGLL